MDEIPKSEYEDDGEGEELEGEYFPQFICMKKEELEEEICESETTSCSEGRTTTGNVLDRMIKDPSGRRPPRLGKWPTYPPKSVSDFEENFHQFRAAQQPTHLSQMCSLRISSEPHKYRQPKIIGTIGSSSPDISTLVELLEAGVNIFMLSMAHSDICNQTEPFKNIVEATNQFRTVKDYEIPIGVIMELKGPEIRTGKVNPTNTKHGKAPEIHLKTNYLTRLTSDKIFEERCSDKIIYVDYLHLANQIQEGMIIYLSDGEIKLKVLGIEHSYVNCLIQIGGVLKDNQKVHIPHLPAAVPTISNYDVECLQLASKINADIVIVPQVRNGEIVAKVKRLLDKEQEGVLVLAKISSFEGLEKIDNILRFSDGIVIQKNELSLDISPEKFFIAQKEIIGKCNRIGKPVLCTTELNSLKTSNTTSSRIEINDIGGAIVDGVDGIILTIETTTGDKGVQAVTYLSNIVREAEAATMQNPFYFDLVNEQIPPVEPSKAIAIAAVHLANSIQAAAILAVTTSGKTAEMLSWFRPRRPVIAVTRIGKTARQLNLWRAILPLHFTAPVLPDWFDDVKARFNYAISYGKTLGIVEAGDLLVLVSGFRKKAGFTNSVRVIFAPADETRIWEHI